ncbi:MAG: NAD(P)-dependent oxidoreductase [Kiritimatiellae bacterium]|nr:NAD(P)-dependent oxidoreductase [Kiritimatiellia bacterium]
MKNIVLVTQAEYNKAAAVFANAPGAECRPVSPDETTLAQTIRSTGCRAVVLGVNQYRNDLYLALAENAGEHGALIARFGFGTDGINKPLAKTKGITLVNTPVDIQTSVAELTLFHIGSLMRHLPRLDATLRAGAFTSLRGRELCGQTALIIGGGRIGLKVMRMLHLGFGVRTMVCGTASETQWLAKTGCSRQTLRETFGVEEYSQDLDALLPRADIVSIHLPLTPGTANLIGAAQLAQMKPGSLLINMGRGGIVDEAALYDALRSGHLGGAAIDVFVNEPYTPVAPDKDLRRLDNTVLTPHCGSDTVEANARMASSALSQASAFLAGITAELCIVDYSS